MKRALLCAPLLLLLVGACSGKGNSGKLEIDPLFVQEVPWTNGVPPQHRADGTTILPADPTYPSIASGAADPGSRVFAPGVSDPAEDCAPLNDVELSGWRQDFEPIQPGIVAVAQFWSAYFDSTDGAWLVPNEAAFYTNNTFIRRPQNIWGLASQAIDTTTFGLPQCGTEPPNAHVLHVKGGRFNYFGGGVEHPLSLDCGGFQPGGVADLCSDPEKKAGEVMDISAYDGIAFWARRGPEGSSGLLVGMQTKDTSGYLARKNKLGPQYCSRIKTCVPACDDGAECVEFTQVFNTASYPRMRCIPPNASPDPMMEPALLDQIYPQCGVDTCKGGPQFPDPDAENPDDPWECKPHTFSGLEENYWCFGSQPPPAPGEQCDDGFATSVSLSTDWQFYKLPFESFRQAGFAKRVERFDLKNVFSIAFQFSVGWADFYVDNVSFYRNK